MNPYLLIVEMIVVGFGVGLISNALGLGGGVLMVPAFLAFIPEFDINTAKGTSLLTIMFVAAFNSWRLNQGHKDVPYKTAGILSIGSIAGAYLGGWVTSLMSDAAVTVVFVALLTIVAARTFFIQQRTVADDEVRTRWVMGIAIGLAAGFVGGATGTGGGAIVVPLALMAGIASNARVVALSNMVMILTCTSGTAAHLFANRTVDLAGTYGQVNIYVAPIVFIGALFASFPGQWLNTWLTLKRRRVVMGTLLIVITIQLLYRALA